MTATPLLVLRCRNCGADVPITSPATILVSCEHCGTLSRRDDVDLETIGEVAMPARLASHFTIGTEGRLDGRSFVVRGQIQLDHGAGLWNEWAAETDEGWVWIAEAQGKIQIYREVEVDPARLPQRDLLPDLDPDTGAFDPGTAKGARWSAGDLVEIAVRGARAGLWTIAEIGRGSVVTCRGEFPIEIKVGQRTTYVDLVRGGGEVATLDFTRPGHAEVLVGRVVQVDDLFLDPSTRPEHTPERVIARDVRCPECGGEITLHDPERAITLGCQHCGASLARENHIQTFAAVEASRRVRSGPRIPLGTRARLRGDDVTVIGYLHRGVYDGGTLYPWSEYLLRAPDGSYRWLVESDGHWTYVEPTQASSFERLGGGLRFGGRKFKHFTESDAEVLTVLGEFYWNVRRGDSVTAADFVDPKAGAMVSVESSPLGVTSSFGRYVPRREMEEAFPDASLPAAQGVGAAQPNPTDLGAIWRTFAILFMGLLASCVAVRVHHASEVVMVGDFGPTPAQAGAEIVQFSDPFTVRRGGANLKISVKARTIDQGYLDVTGALVDEDSGQVTTFATAAQYYHGVSGGESWSEGDRDGSTMLGRVPAGRFRMRLSARGYDRGVNTAYEVVVKSQVPRALWFFLALLLLFVGPIVASIRAMAFEGSRWSKSDHPWSSE